MDCNGLKILIQIYKLEIILFYIGSVVEVLERKRGNPNKHSRPS